MAVSSGAHAVALPMGPFLAGTWSGTLTAGQHAALRCVGDPEGQIQSALTVARYPHGSGSSSLGFSGYQYSGGGVYAHAAEQDVTVAQTNRAGFPGGGVDSDVYAGADGGTAEFVWGLWGAGGEKTACEVSVDDVAQPWRALDASNGVHLTPADWGGGGVVHAITLGAETLRSFQRHTTGRLFALMNAEAAVLQLTQPDGETQTAFGGLAKSAETDGTWTYSTIASAGESRELNLWILEVP